VVEENTRWNSDKLSVEIKLIGDRPAGIVAMDSPIVLEPDFRISERTARGGRWQDQIYVRRPPQSRIARVTRGPVPSRAQRFDRVSVTSSLPR